MKRTSLLPHLGSRPVSDVCSNPHHFFGSFLCNLLHISLDSSHLQSYNIDLHLCFLLYCLGSRFNSWSLLCIFSSVFHAALDRAIPHTTETCNSFSSKPFSKVWSKWNLVYPSGESYITFWETSQLVLLCMCPGELSSSVKQCWCGIGLTSALFMEGEPKLFSDQHGKATTHLRSFNS